MAKHRVERLAQQIHKDVSGILQKEIKDPRVQDITVTDVKLTGDLQQATVYYTTLNNDEKTKEATATGLEKAKGLIRSKVGQRLAIFKTPEIHFERDSSIEYGEHIDALLEQIKDKKVDSEA